MTQAKQWLRTTVIGVGGAAAAIVLMNDTVVLVAVLACTLMAWYRVERSFEKDLTSGNVEE